MSSLRFLRCEAESPESILDRELKQFTAASPPELLVLVDFPFEEYWRPASTAVRSLQISLVAIYHLIRRSDGVRVRVSVCPPQMLGELPVTLDASWLQQLPLPWFELGQPLRLQPVAIPKPWGREIWYTGIEARGVARVGDGVRDTLLPWLLAIAPLRFCHALQRNLILLKILDPLPDPVYGDLYFELHREKREVYIVTHVDAAAWPMGVGAIRFGFNSDLRAEYRDDHRFLSDYRIAVLAYQDVRREIDLLLDAAQVRTAISSEEAVAAAVRETWLEALPLALRQRESELRQAMERFTGSMPLQIGDVVKVPTLVPHSLQHGVRTVEFQTPVYERLILSFAQKVLTQQHWDVDEALDVLLLDPPPPEPFPQLAALDGWREEQIVEFDDFEVRRIVMAPGAIRELKPPRDYALCMAVGGALQLSENVLAADEALLLSPVWRGGRLVNVSEEVRTLLMAYPRQSSR